MRSQHDRSTDQPQRLPPDAPGAVDRRLAGVFLVVGLLATVAWGLGLIALVIWLITDVF